VTLDNLAGYAWERPFYGFAMATFMFGFLGFPLTGGFVAKIYAFSAAYETGWWWLIVAGVIATMVSAAYYLVVVRAMYMRDAAELRLAPAGGSPPRDWALGLSVLTCAVITIGTFFAVQPLIDVAKSAADALPL
jgi:NADH-quinone oxidoreductase subunit N